MATKSAAYFSSVQCGTGRRYFSLHGFKPGEPAIVHLLTHAPWNAHKTGITGTETVRLERMRLRGWEACRKLNVDLGRQAMQIERAVLTWWRQGLFPPYLAGVDG